MIWPQDKTIDMIRRYTKYHDMIRHGLQMLRGWTSGSDTEPPHQTMPQPSRPIKAAVIRHGGSVNKWLERLSTHGHCMNVRHLPPDVMYKGGAIVRSCLSIYRCCWVTLSTLAPWTLSRCYWNLTRWCYPHRHSRTLPTRWEWGCAAVYNWRHVVMCMCVLSSARAASLSVRKVCQSCQLPATHPRTAGPLMLAREQ